MQNSCVRFHIHFFKFYAAKIRGQEVSVQFFPNQKSSASQYWTLLTNSLRLLPVFNGLEDNKICLEGYKKFLEDNKNQDDPSKTFLDGNTFRLDGNKQFLEGNKNQYDASKTLLEGNTFRLEGNKHFLEGNKICLYGYKMFL